MTSTDNVRDRYVDELIGSARILETIDSAAVAEAWASGAVAEWLSLGGESGQLGARIADGPALATALIDWMEGGEPPASGADWVGDVGRYALRRVVQLVQETKPNEVGWILEYEAPSGDRHDLSATVADGELVGLTVGPEGLAAAAMEDETHGLRVRVADAEQAREAIRESLDQSIGQLSNAGEATLPMLVQRLGLSPSTGSIGQTQRVVPPRDLEDDHYAADVVASSLRSLFSVERTHAVDDALEAFLSRVRTGDPDATMLFEVAGLAETTEVTVPVFTRLVGAYLAPVDLSAHTDPQVAALVELEPADWVGVILGLSRSSIGTVVDGDALVTLINRTPEITTTIPKADAARISWTFEQMLYSWEVTGVLDEHGAVGVAASWLLPRAALAVWGLDQPAVDRSADF